MTRLFLHAFVLVTLCLSAPTRADGPALWKLSDPDSEIWLFGTVHILNPDIQWRTGKIDAAFKAADTLYIEAPVADADPAAMQPLIIKYGLNTTGMRFTALVGEEATAYTKQVLASLGQPEAAIARFDQLRPWLAGISLQALHIQARGGNPDAGVDKILWFEAKAAGKQLGYFETLEQQIRILGDLSHEEEVAFYTEGIRQLVEQPDLLDQIVEDWRVGNTAALGNKIAASMGADQDVLYDRMLISRNKDWADQIRLLMKGSGRVFIAVGAGHLAGKGSVQEQLAAIGLKAKRQ